MPYVSAATLVEELREFTTDRWIGEPPDVTRLREFSLPPMGNLPCVLYCNFDLFWAGEQLQVCRQAALHGDMRLPELCGVSALLLERIAARTAKWEMHETVELMRRAAEILENWDQTVGSFVKVMPKDYRRALTEMASERAAAAAVAAE